MGTSEESNSGRICFDLPCYENTPVKHAWTPDCDQVDQVTSSWRLYSIAKHGKPGASAHACANPNLSRWHRKRILKNYLSWSIQFQGLPAMAENPNLTTGEANSLLNGANFAAGASVLTNCLHLLSERSVIAASGSTSRLLTAPLVERTDLPSEAYFQLSVSTRFYGDLRLALASNPSFEWQHLRTMIQTVQDPLIVKAALLNPNTPVKFLVMDTGLDAASPTLADEAIELRRAEVDAWLAEQGLSLDLPLEWIREVLA